MLSKSVTVLRKEVSTFFGSPVAFIFLGAFLAATLFIFFWVDTFFSRNISDVRPLFQWMPILLVFLISALTMKMWSEEKRMGTLEVLMTLPVRPLELVLGKFLACLAMVAAALVLTIGIPLTVSFIGVLDWGPVFMGYFASLFLASAYIAIGLFVSAKSESQISSLIVSSLACLALYFVGSDTLSGLFGNQASEVLRLIGSGSRFESITRGVIDFRDIYYYLSLVAAFLALCLYALESRKWTNTKEAEGSERHSLWRITTALLIANMFAANLWLSQITLLRVDFTRDRLYSISPATKNLLNQLTEPLLIRGYFSERTHPLLAPLVPQIKDLLREYAVSGKGRVRTEFVDPKEDPGLEEEANRKYNIRPIPFQISDKYQASLVNSYFNVVIQYGDKFEVLDFGDLIEVKVKGEVELDVKLRNPEYDITRCIKKVLYGFQDTDSIVEGLANPVTLQAYVSKPEKLPAELQVFTEKLRKAAEEIAAKSGGKLALSFRDPEEGGGELAKEILNKYGFRPMLTSLFDAAEFYYYLTLQDDEKVVQLGLPEQLDEAGARRLIEAGLKRFSPGLLRTVGLLAPSSAREEPWASAGGFGERRFELIEKKLSETYTVKKLTLTDALIPEDVDLLLLIAPRDLNERQVFAIDQFLMKGGTVVLATSPFSVSRSANQLEMGDYSSGLEDWLKSFGLTLEKKIVMDPQNENYPVPIPRNIGGLTVEEIQLIPYPPFVDIRAEGMNRENGITSGIPQLTVNWASPIVVSKEQPNRRVSLLLRSSETSWATESRSVEPDFNLGELGFRRDGKEEPHVLGLMLEGSFASFFKDKKSPLLDTGTADDKGEQTPDGDEELNDSKKDQEKKAAVISGLIDKSADSARIILFSSNEFLSDQTLAISAQAGSERYLNSLQLIENSVDWSLEDRTLLSIRSRGSYSRTLAPMNRHEQVFWEGFNYLLAAFGLLAVFIIHRKLKARTSERIQAMIDLDKGANS